MPRPSSPERRRVRPCDGRVRRGPRFPAGPIVSRTGVTARVSPHRRTERSPMRTQVPVMEVATGSCAPGGSSGKARTLPGPSCQVGCRDSGAPGRMCGERRDDAIPAPGARTRVRSQASPHDCHPERNARRAWRRRISFVPSSLFRAPEILRLRCCAPPLRMTRDAWRRESDAGGRRIPGRKRSFGSGAACFRSGCHGTLRPGSGNGGHRTPGRTRSFGTSAAHRRSGCHGALRPGSDRVVGIGPREHQLLLAPISIASTRRAVPTCERTRPNPALTQLRTLTQVCGPADSA